MPKNAEETKLNNIVDMGLTFSAMVRLFSKGTKRPLHNRLITSIKETLVIQSEEEFKKIHSAFCQWGMKEILLAEKRKRGIVIVNSAPASYGQIAKTFDVVFKVAIYYCHLPNYELSNRISGWLNAAVDTKMMAMLRKCYPDDAKYLPSSIKSVDENTYKKIQEIVRKFIREKHDNNILPVQFDDIYWSALNR